MKPIDTASAALASSILAGAADMTLATVRADGAPHASTVSFASDGLTLYVAIAIDSDKAHDIGRDARVSLTLNAPFRNWSEIQGLSIDGIASFIDQPDQHAWASALLLRKLPAYAGIISDTAVLPWPGMLFIRIEPRVLKLLDYTKGFGHTDRFEFA